MGNLTLKHLKQFEDSFEVFSPTRLSISFLSLPRHLKVRSLWFEMIAYEAFANPSSTRKSMCDSTRLDTIELILINLSNYQHVMTAL